MSSPEGLTAGGWSNPRFRWGVVRFGFLAVAAASYLVSYGTDSVGTVRTTAVTVGTIAVACAALWDSLCQRSRNARVRAGEETKRAGDPLDFYPPVVAFAVLTAIFASTVSGPLKWVLLAACAATAVFSYLSYRTNRL